MRKDPLTGKKIIFGVTGCIAAYKSALLIRDLIKRGAEVKVVMTPAATQFITPLTLSSLSNNNVVVNIFPESTAGNTGMATWHIDMTRWADLILIAPSTINTIAKIAYGFADNALTTLVSASRSPVIIAPAADVDMYQNPLNQNNISKLESIGFYIVSAEEGELASGLSGIGRLAESNKIIDAVELVLTGYKKDLMNEKVLITAGPTYEDIDPVRFIGNRSSGKMGYALAKSAYLRGADVTLISGPSSEIAYQEINYVPVRTASEMKKAVVREMKKNQFLIMSAAVADFKPVRVSPGKIKRNNPLKEIKISETQDILTSFNRENKIVVGFALETNNELANAKRKLKEKQLDMIVLNSLKDKRSGFEFETNKVMILKKNGKTIKLPLQSKFQIANKILSELIKL
ncbi:MAG: bifunctional phosphopantothenoylcysteine decarboxylase/phosphopantothenate--cysteine ligase CoaBC [Bacteroidetes bacterium]|nr:bifunctional phosphopantothenoylcysteine decarboxylase/phosphopantothenate--cysteine ligase CoaBC [Bacteroidota bacterium]